MLASFLRSLRILRIRLLGTVASALLALVVFVAQDARTQTLGAPEGMRWYHEVAEQGDVLAQYNLGTMYAEGKGVPQDYTQAAHWWRRAAEQGDAGAQVKLGSMYTLGRGVPQDDAEAVRWYRLAAKQGHAHAQYMLGLSYAQGQGVPQDDAEAVRWYRSAAEQGTAAAQLELGAMYTLGRGVPRDDAEAVRWYRLAAKQGHAHAQYMLGLSYAQGQGVPRDDAEAGRWCRRAAEQGHADAQNSLAVRYTLGRGVPQDDAEAVRWYRRAAEQGHADAQNSLAVRYTLGRGVPQDDAEAVRWYRRAAEQGHADAQYNLGLMYVKGQGASQDDTAAARWWQRAAEQGHADAQNRLGVSYANGKGVLQDAAEAVRWYRRAAGQGLAAAQYNLGFMFVEGRGVLQDYVAAHKWFNLATSRFSSSERKFREKAVHARNKIALKMTPRQIAEAQQLAREWRPRPSDAPTPDLPVKRKPPVRYTIERASTGSGFFVSDNGHILTNAHVVSGCTDVRIPPAVSVRVAARDDSSDLALLRGSADQVGAVSVFREGRGIRPGADVVVIGYPLHGVVASEANVTKGNVSALAGPGDDRRLFQMTAPVQPGNSGGPVLDTSGHVVGVTVAKLDAVKIARVTGDIPQNVNFAVSAGTARAFLDAQSVPYETARSADTLAPDAVAAKAKKFTVLVECWK